MMNKGLGLVRDALRGLISSIGKCRTCILTVEAFFKALGIRY
ncbi:MAG: hypothetical protein ACI8XU_002777, partial [Kiritimatiellia bacterium]